MIQTAIQKDGQRVDVYDEKGNYLFCQYGQLVGFTGTSVSIKKDGNRIDVYDAHGNYQRCYYC